MREGKVQSTADPVMEIFKPFIHDGYVSLCNDMSDSAPVRILRDTGASQSLLLADVLPVSEKTSTGTNVLIKGVNSSGYTSVPLHNIYLSSDLISGPVTLGIQSSLPFDGIALLLGNDLAGAQVMVNPLVTKSPCLDQQPDIIEQEIPELYPACAVTRAMNKKVLKMSNNSDFKPDNKFEVGLADTFLCPMFSKDNVPPSLKFDAGNKYLSECHMSKSHLITEQQLDPDLMPLLQRAVDESETFRDPICYFTKDGILMRKWRSPDAPACDDWAVVTQIVVPKKYRSAILHMAHEAPLSGHLGVNKTYKKILSNFYWPNLFKDVSEFCKSCHECQMVGKPNQNIPKAHLQPIPAFEEPFSRILVDCVGPLPKTKAGNIYLLTIMCVY